MAARVFVVHGSHPSATVLRALELKGVEHSVVELPATMQPPVMKLLFGRRTVPGVIFAGGERVQGSVRILHRLDELYPEPPLLPADPEARARVEEAEAWGDEVLQPLARRIIWPALHLAPQAMPSFQEGGRTPPLPAPVVRALAPGVTRLGMRLNRASVAGVSADLAALPAHFDRIDGWLEEGLLGGEQPNAADLQIAPSVRLLGTIGDVASLLDGRPADDWSRRLFPVWPGAVPAGVLPGAA